MKKGWLIGLLLGALWLMAVPAGAQTGAEVVSLTVEGPVTPAMAAYFERGLAVGQAQQAEAVLITLDTPGGGLDTTQEIVQLFRGAELPVIVFIAPAGAQAASAGSIITLAAHAAGMAPETVIGAASPVDASGADIEETLYRKVVEDTKALVRGLAERRGPEAVALAESMIESARAVHAQEALAAGIIDAVAPDSQQLLLALDGLEVVVGDRPVTLHTAQAQLRPLPMNVVERLLHTLANPLLVGILLTIGIQALLIELSHPGGWVPGIIGIICLGLALYGLGVLEANWFGLVLMGVAFALFILEVKTPGVGLLGFVGAATLFVGLLVLFNSPGSPDFRRISIPAALGVTFFLSAFFIFIGTMAVRAQRRPTVTGREGLIGLSGRARTNLSPNLHGSITVHGEIWRAIASEEIKVGETVEVIAANGLTLSVKKRENGQ